MQQSNVNNNSTLDRVTNSRILGVNFAENLNWENHVTKVIKTCYSTLASLRKMKRLTDFKLRKQLSEQLVLSKLSYCDTVFDSLTDWCCQVKLVTRQSKNAIQHRKVHKTLYKEGFPDYLKLELTSNIKNIAIEHGNSH